jgi:hypothetical protein
MLPITNRMILMNNIFILGASLILAGFTMG